MKPIVFKEITYEVAESGKYSVCPNRVVLIDVYFFGFKIKSQKINYIPLEHHS